MKENGKRVRIVKKRADELVVAQGLAPDLAKARRLIMAGQILAGACRIDKAGSAVPEDTVLRAKKQPRPFASRGGAKLAAALGVFELSPKAKVALDLGASTGGFTDCLLKAGAQKVYAVDVGTNQLIYALRTDPRVISLERTHAKNLNRGNVPDPIAFLCADVSFTSLQLVLPYTYELLQAGADLVCLFKPQFEAPREAVLPGGLVNKKTAAECLARFFKWLQLQPLKLIRHIPCPVKGTRGNQEELIWLRYVAKEP